MTRKTVMVVFGTRPEAIKMAPVLKELQRHPDKLRSHLVLTAQHREMLDQVMDIFEIKGDDDLDIMTQNQSLSDVTCRIIRGLEPILEKVRPDYLLVQGDTSTTFAAALTGFYQKIPVGHVEAGLRTHNRYYPFPEEINRVLTSSLSSVHFAPTEGARQNLLMQNVPKRSIIVTGNTVIDALMLVLEKQGLLNRPAEEQGRQILVTAHRRENFGKPLEAICRALSDVLSKYPDVRITFPVHLNPNVRKTVNRLLGNQERIELTEPLDYLKFTEAMAKSYLILSDSGGVQEEAPSIGKPVLVLRNETERQEGIDAGTCRLVGPDRNRIFTEVSRLLDDPGEYEKMAQAANPYGDGKAGQRIVQYLIDWFAGSGEADVR